MRAQGVLLGYSLLRANVAEHIQLLLVLSTHTFFLSGCAVETREFRGTASASNRVFPQPASGFGRCDRGWIEPSEFRPTSAASSGIPGIDSLANWSDQFVYAGYDGNGNPQSVWPYTMVGNSPESGRTTSLRAPIVPVTVELLGPDGTVALTFGPDGNVIKAALGSPEFEPFIYTNGVGQFNDQMMRAAFANRISNRG